MLEFMRSSVQISSYELSKFAAALTQAVGNSPMLIPGGSASFIIKEVIHRQSSCEGTTTDILIIVMSNR